MLSLKRPRRTPSTSAAAAQQHQLSRGAPPTATATTNHNNHTTSDAGPLPPVLVLPLQLQRTTLSAADNNNSNNNNNKHHVIRPIAMRPNDAEAFYEEARQVQSLTLPMVHQAVQESYAWHRHWTTEAGRCEEAAQQLQPPDRCRNPSPQQDGSSNSNSSSPIDDVVVHHKRGRGDGTPTSFLAQNLVARTTVEQPVPTREPTILIRPQAMRIAVRPECVIPHLVIPDGKDDDADRPAMTHPASLRPSQSTILVPRTSGGTEEVEDGEDQPRRPPCSHFDITNVDAAATERAISPLTVDADLFQDEDILQTVQAGSAPVNIVQDEDDDDDEPSVLTMMMDDHDSTVGSSSMRSSSSSKFRRQQQLVADAREGLLQELAVTAGETTSEKFQSALQILQEQQSSTTYHASPSHTGLWLTLTKPTFFDCLGVNGNGDPLYTLGRMSFGLCAPTQLVCSLQGNFNRMERVEATTGAVPKSLRQELLLDSGHLETYDIITAFTIEPHSPSFPKDAPNRDVTRPIRGIMTTYGYIIPDPLTPNRYTVWITGGRLEPDATPDNVMAWQTLFAAHPPQHTLTEHAKLLAVQWLMGATLPRVVDTSTGAMEYTFDRPLGGHGVTYLDNLYTDQSLRIWRGHRGTTFVMARTSH